MEHFKSTTQKKNWKIRNSPPSWCFIVILFETRPYHEIFDSHLIVFMFQTVFEGLSTMEVTSQ